MNVKPKLPFDLKPYKVIKSERPQITLEPKGKVLLRNEAQLKLLKVQPERLISEPRVRIWKSQDYDSDDDIINLSRTLPDMGAA